MRSTRMCFTTWSPCSKSCRREVNGDLDRKVDELAQEQTLRLFENRTG